MGDSKRSKVRDWISLSSDLEGTAGAIKRAGQVIAALATACAAGLSGWNKLSNLGHGILVGGASGLALAGLVVFLSLRSARAKAARQKAAQSLAHKLDNSGQAAQATDVIVARPQVLDVKGSARSLRNSWTYATYPNVSRLDATLRDRKFVVLEVRYTGEATLSGVVARCRFGTGEQFDGAWSEEPGDDFKGERGAARVDLGVHHSRLLIVGQSLGKSDRLFLRLPAISALHTLDFRRSTVDGRVVLQEKHDDRDLNIGAEAELTVEFFADYVHEELRYRLSFSGEATQVTEISRRVVAPTVRVAAASAPKQPPRNAEDMERYRTIFPLLLRPQRAISDLYRQEIVQGQLTALEKEAISPFGRFRVVYLEGLKDSLQTDFSGLLRHGVDLSQDDFEKAMTGLRRYVGAYVDVARHLVALCRALSASEELVESPSFEEFLAAHQSLREGLEPLRTKSAYARLPELMDELKPGEIPNAYRYTTEGLDPREVNADLMAKANVWRSLIYVTPTTELPLPLTLRVTCSGPIGAETYVNLMEDRTRSDRAKGEDFSRVIRQERSFVVTLRAPKLRPPRYLVLSIGGASDEEFSVEKVERRLSE